MVMDEEIDYQQDKSLGNPTLDDEQHFFQDFSDNNKSFSIDQIDSIRTRFSRIFQQLQNQYEIVQKTQFDLANQSIEINRLGAKFNQFSDICRSKLVFLLNLNEDRSLFNFNQLETTFVSLPQSIEENSSIFRMFFNSEFIPFDRHKDFAEFLHFLLDLLKQSETIRNHLAAMNEMFVKFVLPESDRIMDRNQPANIPTNFFDENEINQRFIFQINEEKIFIRCSSNENLTKTDFSVELIDDDQNDHDDFDEKCSSLFQIQCRKLITLFDQLIIAFPCFSFSYFSYINSNASKTPQRTFFIRCQEMNSFIHLPCEIELINEIPYAIFRLRQCFASIRVGVILRYPFEILKLTNNNDKSIYHSEISPEFSLETVKNCFEHLPRLRQVPVTHRMIEQFNMERNEDEQMISCSNLFEFQWFDDHCQHYNDQTISIEIPLNTSFHVKRHSIRKHRQNLPKAIDESLLSTPKSIDEKTLSPRIFTNFPTLQNLHERKLSDSSKFSMNVFFNEDKTRPTNSLKTNPLTSQFYHHENDNENGHGRVFLFIYKNRKWKHWNQLTEIRANLFRIDLKTFFDRLILIRYRSSWNNEAKIDKFAESLWSLPLRKLFVCLVAKNEFDYALLIINEEKRSLAEEFLREKNFQSQPLKTKSTFHLSDRSLIEIFCQGNISTHPKVEYVYRLKCERPLFIQFRIAPIDVYRQKINDIFLGILNLSSIHFTGNNTDRFHSLQTTKKSLHHINELEISLDSASNQFKLIDVERRRPSAFKLSSSDSIEKNLLCSIEIELDKTSFQVSTKQNDEIFVHPKDLVQLNPLEREIFTILWKNLSASIDEDQQELTTLLEIHRAWIYSLKNVQHENPILSQWFKRQKIFQVAPIINAAVSSLIQIGRLDLAFHIYRQYLTIKS